MEKVSVALEKFVSELLDVKYMINYRLLLQGYFADEQKRPFNDHLRGMALTILKEASQHEKGACIIFTDNDITIKEKPFPSEVVELFQEGKK
jgi:hypothetical protein